MALTMPRERALRARLSTEFRRVAAHAASELLAGKDPESGLQLHEQNIERLLKASWDEGMPKYGRLVLDSAGKARSSFEQLVLTWLGEVGAKKVAQISATTRTQLRNVIRDARDEGLGTSAIAKRIRDSVGDTINRVRSHVIARTETHTAANAAQLFAAESLGRNDMKREWIAAMDERTRDDHAAADGQVVALEQPFTVGGELIMYPGDGSPEQSINCRCTTGFIVPD